MLAWLVWRWALERVEEFERCEARLREEAEELEDWLCEARLREEAEELEDWLCEARLREEAEELEDWRCEDCACRDRFELLDREELFLLRDRRDLSSSSANVVVPTSISRTPKTASILKNLFTETTSFQISSASLTNNKMRANFLNRLDIRNYLKTRNYSLTITDSRSSAGDE